MYNVLSVLNIVKKKKKMYKIQMKLPVRLFGVLINREQSNNSIV
jgi:hypothetical protein